MITLYGFGRVNRRVIGETRDLRAQWALEEVGLPYRVQGLDHTGGALDSPAYARISCFHQVPVIDDDGTVVAESAAVLLYVAEKAGKLIPADFEGRTRTVQWSFAALTTLEPTLVQIQMLDAADPERDTRKQREELVKLAGRWLGGFEHRLDGREWIADSTFTVADILLASVLRGIRKTELLRPHPRLSSFYERAFARPAWQRTLSLYAERLGVAVADIR